MAVMAVMAVDYAVMTVITVITAIITVIDFNYDRSREGAQSFLLQFLRSFVRLSIIIFLPFPST